MKIPNDIIEFCTLFDTAADIQKWELVIKNQGFLGITIVLDNDFTGIQFEDSELTEHLYCDGKFDLSFNNYIGNSDGITELLTALNIKSEGV